MPVFEITQAGINSINDFDPLGNLPTGNFNYINAYNVDPATFNKDDFKALTTWPAQSTYLSSTMSGARDGYAPPPNFPYQGNSVPLNRVGNAGTDVANQVALRVSKISVDQTNYLYQIANGYGDYYFNLIVVYNTYGVDDEDKESQTDMPIAFIYLFDGIQQKLQLTTIEINAVFQYAGISSTIEFPINPIVSAGLLEVSLPDFLPAPNAAVTNNYLIRDQSPASSTTKSTATTANLCNYDVGVDDNVLLWQFDTHTTFFDSEVDDNVGNTPTQTALLDYRFNSTNKEIQSTAGYIMQVLTGVFAGQCRRVTNIQPTYISWATNFGNTLPDGTKVRLHIPDRIRMECIGIPTAQQIQLGYKVRAIEENVTGAVLAYDGYSGTHVAPWPNTSVTDFTNVINGRYSYNTATNTNVPTQLNTTGFIDVTRNDANVNLTFTDNSGRMYHRSNTADVENLTDIFTYVSNVSNLPANSPTQLARLKISKFITFPVSAANVPGTGDSDNNSIIAYRGQDPFIWSFSTHSFKVCTGIAGSVDNSVPGETTVTLSSIVGTAIANWNLATLPGSPEQRFIVQFNRTGDSNWHGAARGVAVAKVNVADSKITFSPELPTVGVGTITFMLLECNIARLRSVATYSYTDIDANNYSYTLPGGLIVKGGKVNVGNGGSTFTFTGLGHTNFPNKVYGGQLTMSENGDNAIAMTALSTTGFTADHDNGSDKQVYWQITGK